MNRGTRRDRTHRIIVQRRNLHMHFAHSVRASFFTCFCDDKGPNIWSTHRPCSCHCSKRKHGQPKVWGGMCCCDDRKRVYRWRSEVKDLNRLVSLGWETDSDELSVLFVRG